MIHAVSCWVESAFLFSLGCSIEFNYFDTMPRQIFSEVLESKLIDLWAACQQTKSGKMKKRPVREKEIAEELNKLAKENGLDLEVTALIVDSVKSKAEMYKKYKRSTATGTRAAKLIRSLTWRARSEPGVVFAPGA